MSTRLVDAIHDHIRHVDDVTWQVNGVIESLRAVGMDRVADNLAFAIADLREGAKSISNAHIDDVNGQIRHGEHMIGGMLKLALDGCLQPPKKKRAALARATVQP